MRRSAPPLLALALLISLVAPVVTTAQTSGTATTTARLNLRASPDLGSAVITVIPRGSEVSVDGSPQSGFYPVTYRNTDGWVSGDFLRFGGDSGTGGTARVTVRLNLRSGPSTADAVIAIMPVGATVTLTGGSQNGFLSVVYNGIEGWASANFLDTGGGTPPPEEEPPDPPPATGTAFATARLNLRAGPSTADRVLTVIPSGGTVELTGESANGFLSLRFNGVDGWAAAQYLDTSGAPPPDPEPEPPTVIDTATTTASLNLRAGPGTGNAVLTVIPAGTQVDVTGDSQNGFYPVIYRGTEGWAASDFLRFGDAPVSPPPSGSAFSAADPLLGRARGSAEAAIAFARAAGANRQDQVAAYIYEVYRLAPAVGLDPAIVVAQSAHETGNWTSSWWTERLNPAGIGITGRPADNEASMTWANGTDAARGQIVHLGLYAGIANNSQLQQYRYLDPRYAAAVSAGYAGSATTINDLTGTWAVDPQYAPKVTRKANAIFG